MRSKYVDSDGFEYESYEAYCNSPDLDLYSVMLYLWSGKRTPQNETERNIKEELEDIRNRGEIPDFTEGTW